MSPWLLLDTLVLLVTLASLARAGLLARGAVRHARRTPLLPMKVRATVAVPAFNEEHAIEGTVRSIAAAARHAAIAKIVVIDDGSSDGTAAVLSRLADVPQLEVCRLPHNEGKVAALNRAIARCEGEVLVTIDADTRLEEPALARITAPFADEQVCAVAGNVKVANRGGLLGLWQSIEYIGALNIDRRGTASLRCVSTVPGAFGAWRIGALRSSGGFSSDTLAEDTDMTVSIALRGGLVLYEDTAIARTEAPSSWYGLFRQRLRWQHGNLQCLFKHARGMLDTAGIWRHFGAFDFAYKHLLVFLIAPIALLWLPRALEILPLPLLLGISAALFALDLALIALAYRLDRERAYELLHVPLQRALFPMFLWAVFAAVCLRRLSTRDVPWSRAPRSRA